jgi:hypothetical protein
MKSTRPPGRPRVDEDDETVQTGTRLPARQYDEMCERAKAARVTVAEQLRRDVAAAAKRYQK